MVDHVRRLRAYKFSKLTNIFACISLREKKGIQERPEAWKFPMYAEMSAGLDFPSF